MAGEDIVRAQMTGGPSVKAPGRHNKPSSSPPKSDGCGVRRPEGIWAYRYEAAVMVRDIFLAYDYFAIVGRRSAACTSRVGGQISGT